MGLNSVFSKITPLRHAWPGYGKLMREGTLGQAVVLSARWSRWDNTTMRVLTLRVHFDDGTTAEVTRAERDAAIGIALDAGAIVPVRYDPHDHSKVEIDIKLKQQAREEAEHNADKLNIAAAERKLSGEAP